VSSDAAATELGPFFDATSVAVVGASADPAKLGHWPLRSMQRMGFAGRVTGVNPNADKILDYACVPDIESLPEDTQAAIIMLPPEPAIAAVDSCGRRGIRHVVVGASGFGESAAGKHLDELMLRPIVEHDMRLCGPNTDGLANIGTGLALSFQPVLQSSLDLRRGGISVVSHSGAMISTICSAILKAGGGLSCTASCGNQLALHMEDYLAWMATHNATRVILLFIEAIRDAEAMTAALKLCHQAGKQVVALKVGRSDAGRLAVTSHTGAIAGSYENTMSFLSARGVHCASTLTELVSLSVALSVIDKSAAADVALMSISGGLAGLGADMFESLELPLRPLSAAGSQALAEITSATSPINPFDLAGQYSFEHVRQVMDVFVDDNYDTLLVALGLLPNPPRSGLLAALTYGASRFRRTVAYAPHLEPDELTALTDSGIYLSSDLPSVVAVAARRPASWSVPEPGERPSPRAAAELSGSGAIDEWDSKQYLASIGVPVPRAVLAKRSADGRVDITDAAGLFGDTPVAVKGVAAVAHKSELGLVRLGLRGAQALQPAADDLAATALELDAASPGVLIEKMVQNGFEVIVGATRDATFGPVLVVGVGGIYVELARSASVLTVPFTADFARATIADTVLGQILDGHRGQTYDTAALVDVLMTLQAAMLTDSRIQSLEINPLFMLRDGKGALAGDAKIVTSER